MGWPVATVALVGGGGPVRVRRTEEGESVRGREREQRGRKRGEGTRGVLVASLGRPGKQEVAGASPALATELLRALAREEDRRRGGQVGWAAQVGCTVLGCGWAAR